MEENKKKINLTLKHVTISIVGGLDTDHEKEARYTIKKYLLPPYLVLLATEMYSITICI